MQPACARRRPKAATMLSRRPDSRTGDGTGNWCWCRRSDCDSTPSDPPLSCGTTATATAGGRQDLHPDGCGTPGLHARGRRTGRGRVGARPRRREPSMGQRPAHTASFNQTRACPSWPPRPRILCGEADESTRTGGCRRRRMARQLRRRPSGGGFSTRSVWPHLPHIVERAAPLEHVPSPNGVPRASRRTAPLVPEPASWANLTPGVSSEARRPSATPLREPAGPTSRPCHVLPRRAGGQGDLRRRARFTNNPRPLVVDHGWHLGDTNSWAETLERRRATRCSGRAGSGSAKGLRASLRADIFPPS